MTKMRVDTAKYDAGSKVFGSELAMKIGNAASTLESALSDTNGMGRSDKVGVEWSGQYDKVAMSTVETLEDGRRSAVTLGGLLEQSGLNHGRADAHSDTSGKSTAPVDRTTYSPGANLCIAVPSAAGATVDPPMGWELIEEWVKGVFWPTGNPDELRSAASAWRAVESHLSDASPLVSDAVGTLRTQDSPEIDSAVAVCKSFGTGLEEVGLQCGNIARSCEAQADAVDKAHQDLIKEIAEAALISMVIQAAGGAGVLFTGGLDEVPAQGLQTAEIANLATRVTAVLGTLTAAARRATGMIHDALSTLSAEFRTILSKVPILADTSAVSRAAAEAALRDAANAGWAENRFARGRTLEKLLGQNLPETFPTIDIWDGATATSIKTIDLGSKTYRIPSRLKSLVKGYINELAEFDGASMKGITVRAEEIESRVLDVSVNQAASAPQDAVFQDLSK